MTSKTLLSGLLFSLLAVVSAQAQKPVPQIERALIISIDGLRPDLLIRADTPNIRSLYQNGCYSFWARTTEMAVTLPSHVSFMTGVVPDRHGILFNDDRATTQPVYPQATTLFHLAKEAGLTTAIATGKIKFVVLADPTCTDWASVRACSDAQVAEAAAQMIREHKPQVMFVHFPSVDGAGHGYGWGTPEQVKVVEQADAALGQVLDAVEEAGLADSTVILLTADHGGQGQVHGKDDARSRHIPWIIRGPGIRRGFDLTRFQNLQINTEDTFATITTLLGLPLPEGIDGKYVWQILPQPELLQDLPAATTQPSTRPSASGYKLTNSLAAEFAVAADLCPGSDVPGEPDSAPPTQALAMPATQPAN